MPEHLKLYDHIADKQRRTYAAMMHAVDEQIGRVAKAVDQQGLTAKTLFIFSSDNGGPTKLGATNGKLRAGKGTVYEGGTRVAAFAAWPGKIPVRSVVNEPLHMVDWYPTLLKLAGASLEQPTPLDGRDMWATITQGAKSPHDEILLNVTPTNGAIRVGDWKLVLRGNANDDPADVASAPKGKKKQATAAQGDDVELFNLADDLSETKNLAAEHPDKVRDLRARLDRYAKEAVPPKSAPKAADFVTPKVWGE
jgi:arylsulfatase A-like enzyme